MKTVNRPSDAVVEQIGLLTEEMGESQQIIGKIQRHGLDSTHPDGGPVNAELLEYEIGHVLAAVDILVERGTLVLSRINESRIKKLMKVEQYLHCDQNIAAVRSLVHRERALASERIRGIRPEPDRV